MSKQTAVELLEKEFNDTFYVAEFGEMGKRFKKIFEQAKAMEREQIITAFCEGYDHDGDNYDGAEISYYNRTYKGGKDE